MFTSVQPVPVKAAAPVAAPVKTAAPVSSPVKAAASVEAVVDDSFDDMFGDDEDKPVAGK